MSVDNCRIVCREIEEADRGASLTKSAMAHLDGCGECQRFYDERLKLRQLVASLETVTAPADFDLRVRSRIANERMGTGGGLWFSSFSFGVPSFALASLVVLVVGLVFALKVWNAPSNRPALTTETSKEAGPSRPSEQPSSIEKVVKPVQANGELANVHDGAGVTTERRHPKKRVQTNTAVASVRNGERPVTQEFSSTRAPVIKQEEAVASLEPSVFTIETSSQPMRLSLDYSGGISRTISVPALSFGSERVLTGGSTTLVRNSTKGAW